jgi:hypothetical protein
MAMAAKKLDRKSQEWAAMARSVHTFADSEIRRIFLSDANLGSLLHAFRRFGSEVLAMTKEELETISFGSNDAITQAVWGTAQSELARTATATDAHLRKMNSQCFKIGHRNLSVDLSSWRRWDEFLEYGVNPAMAEHPKVDRYRAEMRLSKRPLFGRGATFANPWESVFGGAVDDFSQMWDLVSTKRADTAGTAEYRVKIMS